MILFGRFKKINEEDIPKMQPWYDIHCHFLPGMDDGCSNEDEALAVLRECRKKGIVGMIATPHYYPKESIDNFVKRRKISEEKLISAAEKKGASVPEWCLGAETSYHLGLVKNPDLEKLCLGKSRILLLELPFEKWSYSVLRDVHELINVRNVTPVIAHLERYFSMQNKDIIRALYETGAMIQMNAEYILGSGFRKAIKRIDEGEIDLLGSDVHNMKNRRPNLREAVNKLEMAGYEAFTREIRHNNKMIFESAMGKHL